MSLDLFSWAHQERRKLRAPPPHNPRSLPADALPPEFHAIVRVLSRHVGRDNAITAPDVAIAANLWPDTPRAARGTKVRAIINRHREDLPWFLCGDAAGLYVAATLAERNAYQRQLLSRIRAIGATYKACDRRNQIDGLTRLSAATWSTHRPA